MAFLGRVIRSLMSRSSVEKRPGIAYEGAWDAYSKNWDVGRTGMAHLGDEWIGREAGAAETIEEYERLIESRCITPYITLDDTVLEIGVGGGRTAALLLKHCDRLICADISSEMLNRTRRRLGSGRVSYVKLDGLTLQGIQASSVDVCFSYDTMVHLEPRDIFNYLTLIPTILRGKRICVFHHANVLSDLGWKRFLSEWDRNLMGKRQGGAFSVMTDGIMGRFLTHLNYEVLIKDSVSVPRDCIWVCKAPIITRGLEISL